MKTLLLELAKYFSMAIMWLAFLLVGLWCCSCSCQRPQVVIAPHQDYWEFDINDVAWYDADRNVCGYVVLDTVKSRHQGRLYTLHYVEDTVELHLNGILIEELEQGTPAWVSEGVVLYD